MQAVNAEIDKKSGNPNTIQDIFLKLNETRVDTARPLQI